MKGPFADQGIEGPGYADRIKGRLTFRDWDHWTEEDREEYRAEFIANDRPAREAAMKTLLAIQAACTVAGLLLAGAAVTMLFGIV
jgi:hypothetical protein